VRGKGLASRAEKILLLPCARTVQGRVRVERKETRWPDEPEKKKKKTKSGSD
jgi:hypothetical protein